VYKLFYLPEENVFDHLTVTLPSFM